MVLVPTTYALANIRFAYAKILLDRLPLGDYHSQDDNQRDGLANGAADGISGLPYASVGFRHIAVRGQNLSYLTALAWPAAPLTVCPLADWWSREFGESA